MLPAEVVTLSCPVFVILNILLAELSETNKASSPEPTEILTLPIFIEAIVTKSDIATRMDTVTAQMKRATLETGLEIDVPVFIKEGDTIKVDTRTGTYVERVVTKK